MHNTPQWVLLIQTITDTSLFWISAVGIIAWLLYVGRRFAAIRFILALILTTGAVTLLKEWLAVPRPADALATLDSYAFPSGHAAGSAFLAFTIWHLFVSPKPHRRTRYWLTFGLFTFAVLVALSRVLIGVHTIPQVFAGALLGVLIPLLIFHIKKP